MYQANTLDSALVERITGEREARPAIEKIRAQLLDVGERIGALFSRAEPVRSERAPAVPLLSGYYAGARERVRSAEPIVSFRKIETVRD